MPVSADTQRRPIPENVVPITLADGGTTSTDPSVRVAGSTVTITQSGAYALRGTLTAGRDIVESDGGGPVWLMLDGVDITNPTSAAIAVMDAGEAVIVLAEGTQNCLVDGPAYTFSDPTKDEPNATLYSKAGMTIDGAGSLTVTAAYNDGIAGKDTLTILAGDLAVTAADDGIRGRDALIILGGSITVKAGGDGLTSDNDEDAEHGSITVAAGTLNITSAGDAIQAHTNVHIIGGDFHLTAGNGSRATLPADRSREGSKAALVW